MDISITSSLAVELSPQDFVFYKITGT